MSAFRCVSLTVFALVFVFGFSAPVFAAGAWTATGSMTDRRAFHTITLLPNGKVLVAGGQGIDGEDALASAELYDPATGAWTITGSMNERRYRHTATLLPDGKVLVAGGGNNIGVVETAELYDPVSGVWATTGSMSVPRVNHTAELLVNNKVLIAGGVNLDGSVLTSELYDVNTGTWTSSGVTNDFHVSHTSTLLPDGRVLITGGRQIGAIATSEIYEPATGVWAVTAPMTSPRHSHTATLLPNGKVLVAGGIGPAPASAELFDPISETWVGTGSMLRPRNQHTATLLTNGRVLVASDPAFPDAAISSELFHPGTGTWMDAGMMVNPRVRHAATLLPSGEVLVVGGGAGTYLTSAEVYEVPQFNLPPVLDPIGDKTIDEGQILQFTVTAADPDVGDAVILSANNLPTGAIFDPQTGLFSWTPGFDEAGEYSSIEFVATDDGDPVETDSETISITVNNVNSAPVLDSIGDKLINEGELLQFVITANDPDNDDLTFSAANLPTGASFDPETATFSWTPTFSQAGTYPNIEFMVADDGDPALFDSEVVVITVNDVAPLELTTTADAFLRGGQTNRNEGANPRLTIQSSGNHRTLAAFDETAIDAYVAEHGISSAALIFTIAENGNNWGSIGRIVDAHPLLLSFIEGNGKDLGLPGSESTRGTGPGVTWDCTTDTMIENQTTNCNPQWNGGSFGVATSPSVTHINGQSGTVSWDVTQDVLNGSFSWLIKKSNEGQSGKMEYYSKEGAATAGNMLLAPRLVLTP